MLLYLFTWIAIGSILSIVITATQMHRGLSTSVASFVLLSLLGPILIIVVIVFCYHLYSDNAISTRVFPK
jgi:small-conductance mechanosensitive channel